VFGCIVRRRGIDGPGHGAQRDLSEGVSHGLALESTVAERLAVGFVLLSDDTTKEWFVKSTPVAMRHSESV
jgi:hypothetical protein